MLGKLRAVAFKKRTASSKTKFEQDKERMTNICQMIFVLLTFFSAQLAGVSVSFFGTLSAFAL